MVDHVQNRTLSTVDYHKNMGPVDRQDVVLQLYSGARKSTKWYRKLAFHSLQMAQLNAHILYTKSGGDQTLLQFSHDVTADLMLSGDVTSTEKVESVVWLTGCHFYRNSRQQPLGQSHKPGAECATRKACDAT